MSGKGSQINPVEAVKFLKNIKFPAWKEDLIEHARQNGAPDYILEMLDQLQEREFSNAADVTKGIGEVE